MFNDENLFGHRTNMELLVLGFPCELIRGAMELGVSDSFIAYSQARKLIAFTVYTAAIAMR